MALIQCKECGKEISTQAKTCPNCGAKTETSEKTKNNIVISICIISVIAIISLSAYFIYTSNPIYKYKQEAISILKEYKENKSTITINELEKQIDNLQNEFDKQYKNNDNPSYFSFSTGLSLISSSLYLDSIHNDTLSNSKIDEYIRELQKY